MELSSIFEYAGWKIKYTLLEPQQLPATRTGTIVFVHSTTWSSVVFLPLAKALISRLSCCILLYDLPGYGQSQSYTPKPRDSSSDGIFEGDTSVSSQAAVLSALLSELELDGHSSRPAPAVIAHDIAGTIVLRAHLIHHCEYRSMLLMDTNTVLPWGDGIYKLVRSQPEVFLQLPTGIFEAVVRAVTRSALHDPKKLDGGWENYIVQPWIQPGDDSNLNAQQLQSSFVRQIAQANDNDVAEMLQQNLYSQVRCDVKILWGENDQWILRDKMEQLSTMLGSRLQEFVVVPEAGHLIMIDQPERVAIEVLEWVSRTA